MSYPESIARGEEAILLREYDKVRREFQSELHAELVKVGFVPEGVTHEVESAREVSNEEVALWVG